MRAVQIPLGSFVVLGIGSIGLISGNLIAEKGLAQEAPNQRIAGSYVCLNNPAPECRNPERRMSPGFACRNNPNPECRNPPRPRTELKPGSWSCLMNQNVVCDNTIRYSVENREAWARSFEVRSTGTER
jgi:hypothetical protein